MFKLLSFLGALALMMLPTGQASASSLTEELSIFYTSPGPFTINNLFFGIGTNLINLANRNPGPVTGGTNVSLFSQSVTVDTSQKYTFSFGGTFAGSANDITITGTSQSFGAFQSPSGKFSIYLVGGNLSPVPLPASFPLFALALVCLAGFAYHTARAKRRATVESNLVAAATS